MTNPARPSTSADCGDQLLGALHWRYATKVFAADRKLTPDQWATLEQALVLSASSYGMQPWKFVHVADGDLRAQLKAASRNQPQITDASHMIVFAARAKVETKDIEEFLNLTAQTRGVPTSALEQYKGMMLGDLVNGPRASWSFEWAARQCYIALGNLLTSAAVLGIDACPMEGFDPVAYDRILNLPATGYRAVVVCTLGFRSASDKYAGLKKVRYPARAVVVRM